MSEWIKCSDQEPRLGDYSVLLMHFENGSIDTVHVDDFFKPIPNGIQNGFQRYTKWWIKNSPKCTHWMPLPDPPQED
jgi:hypothetical protein